MLTSKSNKVSKVEEEIFDFILFSIEMGYGILQILSTSSLKLWRSAII